MTRDYAIESLPQEQWKSIPGFEGFYEISSFGRVRSLERTMKNKHGTSSRVPAIMLRPDFGQDGYARVSLHCDGMLRRESVHRLVARQFLDGIHERRQVNHKDGNKQNNRADNLEWVTARENVLHAWRMGLCMPVAGEQNGNSKLSERDVAIVMSAAARDVPSREISRVFNITEAAVSAIIRGKSWKSTTTRREAI